MEANATVDLVLFELHITELQMCENCDFDVTVNILTPLRVPCVLGLHDTLPCVLIHLQQQAMHIYGLAYFHFTIQ